MCNTALSGLWLFLQGKPEPLKRAENRLQGVRGRKGEISWEPIRIIQARESGGLGQEEGSEGLRRGWLGLYLEVEIIGFADRLKVECKREESSTQGF